MTSISMPRFLRPRTVAAMLALGVAGFSQAAVAAPAVSPAVSGVAAIPVTFTTVTPSLKDSDRLCQVALEAVATGQPVPTLATPCLRTFLLETDTQPVGTDVADARPSPEACEALLPSLAIGKPLLLGAAVPCIEDYVTLGGGQVAAR